MGLSNKPMLHKDQVINFPVRNHLPGHPHGWLPVAGTRSSLCQRAGLAGRSGAGELRAGRALVLLFEGYNEHEQRARCLLVPLGAVTLLLLDAWMRRNK